MTTTLWSPLLCITRDDKTLSHSDQVRSMVSGGARFIQARSKDIPFDDLIIDLREALLIARDNDASLIVNDYCELAAEIGADGVHLGVSDRSIPSARELLGPDKIIGKTVHSLIEAGDCRIENPDYVGLGPYRRSPTKSSLTPSLCKDDFRSITSFLAPMPCYLIGGLHLEDFSLIDHLGVQGLAFCSALFSEVPLEENVRKYAFAGDCVARKELRR